MLQEIASGAMRRIGEAAVNLAGAAFSKLGDVIGDSISAARESNQVAAQTAQVIKSTGSAAGVTAQHVLDYASALSAASGQSLFGDEQIAQSTNLLLTFTNIRGATLDAATAISVDMAQALGGAPKDAAIQLGKALNDPIKGITALTRVGVTFSDEQKAMIKAMTEAGDTAGAQKVILDELNKEFGGSAKAAADADGGFAQFQDRLGEMEETIGKAILPVIGQLLGIVNDQLLPVIENAANQIGPFITSLQPMIGAFQELIAGLIASFANTGPLDTFSAATSALAMFWSTQLQPALQAVWTVLQTQVWPILQDLGTALFPLVGAAIQILAGFWVNVLVPAVKMLWEILTTVVLPVIAALAGWLRDNLPGAIQTVTGFLTGTLFPALHSVYDFINVNVVPILAQVAEWLITKIPIAVQATANFWNTVLWPALQNVWVFFRDNIIPIIETVVTVTFVALKTAIQELATLWTDTLWPALKKVWDFINDNIIPLLTTLASVTIAVVKKEVQALSDLWTLTLYPALKKVWDFINDSIVPIFKTIVDTTIPPVLKIFSDLSDLFNKTFLPALTTMHNFIKTTLSPVLDTLNTDVLKPMKGFWEGISDAVSGLISNVYDFVTAIKTVKIPSWLQGASPPPLADWFSYISDSVAALNAQLPTLQMQLAAQIGPQGQSISSTSSTRSFVYSPTINASGGVSAPMDLALANSLASV